MSELIFEKFSEDGRQLIFDRSSLTNADKCLFYYQKKDIERWRSPRNNIAAAFGTLVHASLEEYDHVLTFATYEEAVDAAVKKALELAPELAESEDNARTPETLVRAVVWYCDKYRNDPFKTAVIDIGDGPQVAVELRYEVDIPNTDYRMSGRIDRLAVYDGDLYIIDRKTTKLTITQKYLNSFMPGWQFATYLWALPYMGLKVKGVLVEACQTMVNGTRWERERITMPRANLAEHEREIQNMVSRIDKAWEENFWPKSMASCNMYGGCEMRFVCNAPVGMRERFLKDRFEVVPYTPPI